MTAGKRFKTTYLHIGLGKTGTTAVQADLLDHARALEARHDLHYPARFPHLAGFEGNHSLLLRALFSDDEAVRERLKAIGLHNSQRIERFNEHSLSRFHKGFADSPAQRLLLSAESVGHFRQRELQQLADWLQSISDEVCIIACVRHPLAALSSSIQQVLTVGGILEELYRKPPIYRFRALFERLEKCFGRDNIIAYDFADAVESNDALAAVLLARIGVDVSGAIDKRPPDNTSMSHEAALLLSALNQQRPIVAGGRRNPLHSPRATEKIMDIPGRKFIAPPAVYRRVARETQAELDWLLEHYGLALKTPATTETPGGYYRFGQDSINTLALQVADLARLEHGLLSPLRRQHRRLRLILGKIF